jgi:hypothetical protein
MWNVMFAVQTQTATMDSVLVSSLRSAVTNGNPEYDEVMDYYYDKINPGSTRYDGEGDDWREDRASYESINKASGYATKAFLGVIDVELEYSGQDTTYLNNARKYLLEPSFHDPPYSYYLDLDSLFTEGGEFYDGEWIDCLYYGRLILNVAFIVDMLWYYDNGAYQTDLYNKLEELTGWAEILLNDTTFNGGYAHCSNTDYPPRLWTSYHNGRLRLAGGLGYAGCVLENENYVKTAEDDLFNWDVPGDQTGFLPFMTTNSGLYSEGMNYAEFTFRGLTYFFVARKRLTFDFSYIEDNIDWFSDERVRKIYINGLDMVAPNLGWISFDDVIMNYISSSSFISPPKYMFSEMVTYFYNSPEYDTAVRDHIKWLVNSYYIEYSRYSVYENTNKLYAFNEDSNRILGSYGSIPEQLANGTFSNEETTIFRRNVSSLDDFTDYPVLVVNHENSPSRTAHEHSDQSSFILYYKGEQLLIDPGYRPSNASYYIGKEWLASAYAHNLIMVNPHDVFYDNITILNEDDELEYDYWTLDGNLDLWNGEATNIVEFQFNKFEPIGQSGEWDDNEPKNPAIKNFLIKNKNIEHLQVEVEYDHPQGEAHYPANKYADLIDITRNYYSFDIEEENPYFIIYDEIDSSDPNIENVFMNQLHFAPSPVPGNTPYNGIDELTYPSGNFTYKTYDETDPLYLHGVMGALNTSEETCWSELSDLPIGLYQKSEWYTTYPPPHWEHRSLRINTSTSGDENFLTLLIPSEEDTNPIEEISQEGATYAVKFSVDTDYNIYTAVSDAGSVYLDYGNTRFVTDASFFLVEANNIFTDFKKIILNSDNYLEVRDMSGTDFTDVVVFDSDYDFEEMLASYEEDSLVVTFKTEYNNYLKYKISRSNVEPQYFRACSYFDRYLNGTQPSQRYYFEHVQSLAYDDNYFYVNYDYNDLENENLLTEELTIYKGVFDNIEIAGTSKFGLGEIEFRNEITIPLGTEMKFVPGSHAQMTEDAEFVVTGQVTAIGDSLNIIEFDKKLSTNWKGFYMNSNGAADFRYCKFTEAERPIICFGDIHLENSEITNCDYGLHITSPSSFEVSGNSISDCNIYGVFIGNYSLPMTDSYFEGNTISNCQNGLFLFNTNTVVDSNFIHSNSLYGVFISHRSYPPIQSSFIGNTRNGDIDNPEIYLIDDSYPVLDYQYNDIIIESGGISRSIYNANTGPEIPYYCRENYWGEVTITEISQSFYPEEWSVFFEPVSERSNTGFDPPMGGGGRLFDEGLQAEKEGDLLLAKEKYLLSIDQSPNDVEALWSASRLINCVDLDIGFGYYEAQQLYEGIMADSLNLDLYELSKQSAINCDRKMDNFQDAVYKYEIMFEDSLSFIDSVFTQLDIVYTYMEAEAAGGRNSGLRFISDDHAVRNSKHARKMENELLGLLMQETEDGGIYSPIIEKVKLHGNYPNPFNPETKIAFSIPEYSAVNLSIYNIKGQKVKTIVDTKLEKGIHEVVWNGRNEHNKSVASGVYFYKLRVNGRDYSIKKCLMLK